RGLYCRGMTAFGDEPGDGVLARAAALLDAFDDEHRELTLAALVGRSGLPRSTAHRMAAQMVALGWLDKPGGAPVHGGQRRRSRVDHERHERHVHAEHVVG